VKKAGVDQSRLLEAKPAGDAEGDEPQVKLDLAEPENPERPGRGPAEFLRKLTSDADTTKSSAR